MSQFSKAVNVMNGHRVQKCVYIFFPRTEVEEEGSVLPSLTEKIPSIMGVGVEGVEVYGVSRESME